MGTGLTENFYNRLNIIYVYIYKEKNNVLFAGYVKYILHHEPDHTFSHPNTNLKIQTYKYTHKYKKI